MVKLRVNGQEQSFDGDPSMPLLWYLPDELGLTGTKYGCGVALCGACTVHIDGEAARACITAVSDIAGRSVTTIKGLDPQGNHPVQKAWRALNVPQCGYCHGQGIAVHRSFLSYVATVVEVAVDEKGKLTIPRVDTAIYCGFAANPERIYSQVEGAAVMGLGIAKYGEISFKNGRVQQNNFDGFQVLRIDESPPITHVWIVPNSIDVPSSGVGEPGLPPLAPALCNAIFVATGKRIRRLPIGDQLAT